MKILDAINLTEELTAQATSSDLTHAPVIRATRIGSQEFPKIEVQVGSVLFSANNEEIAVYVPSIKDNKLSPEDSLSKKLPLEEASDSDIRNMLDNAFGMGITLHSMKKNGLSPLGVANSKIFATREDRVFAYDFNQAYQMRGQTLLRVTEDEATPTCEWAEIPPIHCRPHLAEVMADQLSTAVHAAVSTTQHTPIKKSPEQILEEQLQKKLESAFPTAKSKVQIKTTSNETHFSMLVAEADFQIEEYGYINELGEVSESSRSSGTRQRVFENQQKISSHWEELISELTVLHDQAHPSPTI